MADLANIQKLIIDECEKVKSLLLQKNKDYGSSFSHPIKVFSKLSPEEQINVRIDDKLNRISTQGIKMVVEDTEQDLIGYLILKRVLRKL